MVGMKNLRKNIMLVKKYILTKEREIANSIMQPIMFNYLCCTQPSSTYNNNLRYESCKI
uniref:Uncharacterized protein n=1 Tax=Heterorhabditis bacteriophora TaxID=37862 RepID=A0A1I7W6W3_HETBA